MAIHIGIVERKVILRCAAVLPIEKVQMGCAGVRHRVQTGLLDGWGR